MRAEVLASYPIPPTNETGTVPVTKNALSFEVDSPDAMTVLPPWVNVSPEGIKAGRDIHRCFPLYTTKRDAYESISTGTPESALLGLSCPKAVDAKVASLLSSGGNFIVPSW